MFKRLVSGCLLLCFVMLVTSCATIMHGTFQKINVNTEPAGATVTASNGETCTTPGILTLKRSERNYTLNIKKEGYKDISITLSRKIDSWFWGNVLIGGIIGIVVDMSTGAAYKISPSKIDEILVKEGINASSLDTKDKMYIYVSLKELHQDLNLSDLEKIN